MWGFSDRYVVLFLHQSLQRQRAYPMGSLYQSVNPLGRDSAHTFGGGPTSCSSHLLGVLGSFSYVLVTVMVQVKENGGQHLSFLESKLRTSTLSVLLHTAGHNMSPSPFPPPPLLLLLFLLLPSSSCFFLLLLLPLPSCSCSSFL